MKITPSSLFGLVEVALVVGVAGADAWGVGA